MLLFTPCIKDEIMHCSAVLRQNYNNCVAVQIRANLIVAFKGTLFNANLKKHLSIPKARS